MGALTFPPAIPALVLFGRDQAGKPHASWFDAPSAELATKAAGLMSMRAVPVESDELRELVTSLPRGRVFSSGRAFTPFVKGKLYERLVDLTRDMLGLEPTPEAISDEREAGSATVAVEPGNAAGEDAAAGAAGSPATDGVAAPVAAAPEASSPKTGRAATPIAAEAASVKPAAPAATKPSPRPTRIEEIGPGSTVLATTGAAEGWYEARVFGVNGSTFTLRWVDYNEASFIRRGNELGFLPRLTA